MALPQKYRFNIRKDFLNLKKQGKMINSESFGLLYAKNGGQTGRSPSTSSGQGVPTIENVGDDFYIVPNRFNYIVSTKIAKNAVDRNLVRRRLSEITRELLLDKNIYGVFLCKKAVMGKTYQELRNEVVGIVGKIC